MMHSSPPSGGHALRRFFHLLSLSLLLTSTAFAAEGDDFQLLLQNSGLPESAYLPPGKPLAPDKAQALWRALLDTPTTLRTFAPRTVLARLVREALASAQPLPYAELLARSRRFRQLVVLRPDGYVSTALSGKPLASLGAPTLSEGEWYSLGLRVGAFYFNDLGVFFAVDDSLQKQGTPLGELPLGRDPATAALLGAEEALGEMAQGLATLLSEPIRALPDLTQLPSAVAGLIASSPEYFARYGAMNLDDQVREAARLATHLLVLRGGSSMAGPRLASSIRQPVLTLSARGALVVREVAVPAGTLTAVVGAGASASSVVLMAQASGPAPAGAAQTSWPPPPAGPGQWVRKTESMSAESQAFQSQVTGAPEGWVYRVRTGPGPMDFVDFDGFKNGVLLEVKGPGYENLLAKMNGKDWFRGLDEMIDQAKRQIKAANHTPIEWHFAERKVADLVRAAFMRNRLQGIKIFPPPANP
jgi:hypothetical protein